MKQIEAKLPNQFDKNFIPNARTKPTDKLEHQPEVANVPKKAHESLVVLFFCSIFLHRFDWPFFR